MIEYRAAKEVELPLILALQQANLPRAISATEAQEQGFVTLEHDLDLLQKMNIPYGHTVAVAGGQLAGYALTMTTAFKGYLPVIDPLFAIIEQLTWQGQPLAPLPYVVMGQVCVAKAFRGKGVFTGLYQEMAQRLAADFQVIITEISARNSRSLRAHEKVGFQELHRYTAPDEGRWVVVGLPTPS